MPSVVELLLDEDGRPSADWAPSSPMNIAASGREVDVLYIVALMCRDGRPATEASMLSTS